MRSRPIGKLRFLAGQLLRWRSPAVPHRLSESRASTPQQPEDEDDDDEEDEEDDDEEDDGEEEDDEEEE